MRDTGEEERKESEKMEKKDRRMIILEENNLLLLKPSQIKTLKSRGKVDLFNVTNSKRT